jgi:peptide chain release factor 1
MFDRLAQMEARYDSLSRDMSDPTLVNDQKKFQAIAKEHRDMEQVVEKYRQYRKVADGVAEAKAMLAEPDLKEMAEEELATLEPQLEPIEEELKIMLLPKDPNDEKNIVIELRAGTGGDEAALFVAEMFRVYLRFAEQHRWKVQVLSESYSGIGNGLKEVTAIFEV